MTPKPNGQPASPPPTQPVAMEWDFNNNRVTLKQKKSELAIYPAEVTLTFESVELLFFILFNAALQARGVLSQAQAPSPIVSPSGSPSDLSRLPPSERPQ